MSSSNYFYPFTDEDKIAYQYQQMGKINSSGKVIKASTKNIHTRCLEIDESEVSDLIEFFKNSDSLLGRCRAIPLNINVSIKELAVSLNQVSRENFQKYGQLFLIGNGMWHFIAKHVYLMMRQWTETSEISNFITRSFQLQLNMLTPNDYDWELEIQDLTVKAKDILVNQGIVSLLAKKFESQRVNPYSLRLQLSKYQKKIKKYPTHSYIYQVLKEVSLIKIDQSRLHHLFVKSFAFSKAADVEREEKQNCFSLRTLKVGNASHDLFIPLERTSTRMYLDSLSLDLSAYIQNQEAGSKKVYLKSFLSAESKIHLVIQALSDRNLILVRTHFDSKIENDSNYDKSHNSKLFVRAIALFTMGGRCYENHSLQKMEAMLQKEAKNSETPFVNLLAKQLIDYADAHFQSRPSHLIALTFNTCAILLHLHIDHKKNVQNLWPIVFEYLDKQEMYNRNRHSHSLIIKIQGLLSDPSFDFEDLYAQIQISSHLAQHSAENTENILCKPSQTDGCLFTQIKLTVPAWLNEDKKLDFITLFFPYRLPEAFHRLAIAKLETSQKKIFKQIHDLLNQQKSDSIGFGNSILKNYAKDPRRQLSLCQKNVSVLLNTEEEHTWLMGYQSFLSFLSLEFNDLFLEQTLKSFLDLINSNWASSIFKKHVLEMTQSTFNQSEIDFNWADLKTAIHDQESLSSTQNKLFISSAHHRRLIENLLQSDHQTLIKVGFNYLNQIDAIEKIDVLLPLYTTLIEGLEKKNPSKKENLSTQTFVQIIKRINQHSSFSKEIKLKWFFYLYGQTQIVNEQELESHLFDYTVSILGELNQLSNDFVRTYQSKILKLSVQMLKCPQRAQQPLKSLEFVQEIYRLKMIDSASIPLIWDQILVMNPHHCHETYHYLKKCWNLAKHFNYWNQLTTIQKKEFEFKFLKVMNLYFDRENVSSNDYAVTDLNKIIQSVENPAYIEEFFKQFLENKVKKEQVSVLSEEEVLPVLNALDQLLEVSEIIDSHLFLHIFKKMSGVTWTLQYAHELNQILFKFSQIDDNRLQLKSFLFEIVRQTHSQLQSNTLSSCLYYRSLESIFNIFICTNKNTNCKDSDYQEFVDYLFQEDHINPSNQKMFSLCNQNIYLFLNQLYQKKLWSEIFFFFNSNLFELEIKTEILPIFIQVILLKIQNFSNEQLIETIEHRLNLVPERLLKQEDLKGHLQQIYELLFLHYFEQKNFAKAAFCLEKQKKYLIHLGDNFYNHAFDLFEQIIQHGYIYHVSPLMNTLQTPLSTDYELKWFKLFDLLLKHQPIPLCLSLIQKKQAQKVVHQDHLKLKWIDLLKQLIQKAISILNEKEVINQKEKIKLYQMIHISMWAYLPTDQLMWENYIKLAEKKFSKDLIEDLLLNLVDVKKIEPYFNDYQQINIWKKLMAKLAVKGSNFILEGNKWLPKTWDLFIKFGTNDDKQILLGLYLQGTVKSLKVIKKQNLKKDYAQKIIESFEENNAEKFLQISSSLDAQIHLNFAKLFLCNPTTKNVKFSILCLMTIFTLLDSGALIESQAVETFNECLETMIISKCKDPSIIEHIILLIRTVQQIEQSQDANYFQVLKYLFSIESPVNNQYPLPDYINRLYLYQKKDTLIKILENPWRHDDQILEEKKHLFNHTLYQMVAATQDPFISHFFVKYSNHKNLKLYVNPELDRKLSKLQKKLKLNIVYQIFADKMLVYSKLYSSLHRYRAIQKMHTNFKFKFLKEEEKALQTFRADCSSFCIKLTIIACLTIGIFQYLSQLSLNEQ